MAKSPPAPPTKEAAKGQGDGTALVVGPHLSRGHFSAAKEAESAADPKEALSVIEAALSAATAEAAVAGLVPRCFQIFVAGPQQRRMLLTTADQKYLAGLAVDGRLDVYAHAAYVSYPWNGDPTAAAFLRGEVAACAAAGIKGLVVHLPNKPVAEVLKYIPRLLVHGRATRIYLEMVAATPANAHYDTPAKLALLFDALRKYYDPQMRRFGICVDTSHIWSSGQDISTRAGAEKWVAGLDKRLGDVPLMLHLNDNKYACGEGKDEHSPLLTGAIWGKYALAPAGSGLPAFVAYARKRQCPVILERGQGGLPLDYAALKLIAP